MLNLNVLNIRPILKSNILNIGLMLNIERKFNIPFRINNPSETSLKQANKCYKRIISD